MSFFRFPKDLTHKNPHKTALCEVCAVCEVLEPKLFFTSPLQYPRPQSYPWVQVGIVSGLIFFSV